MKNSKPVVILLGVVGVLLLGYFYLTNRSSKNYIWSENYNAESKQPYGLFAVYNLMENYFPEDSFLTVKKPLRFILSDSSKVTGSYLFVGGQQFLNYQDTEALLDFVDKGNDAMIVSKTISDELLEYINPYYCGEFEIIEDSVVNSTIQNHINRSQSSYNYEFKINWENKLYIWNILDLAAADTSFCDNYEPLGFYKSDELNFFRIKYGEGYFYFHLNPIMFTNYYVLDSTKVSYNEEVLSYLKKGDIIWDDFSRFPYSDEVGSSESPLRFILQQSGLRSAWYLMLALVLVYFLFYIKRRQRIVPVLAGNDNSSIEFAETIGRLYFLQQQHIKLVNKKLDLFLAFIRNHYNIQTNQIDDDFSQRVSLKSGIAKADINIILSEAKRLKFITDISDKELIEFHKLLESFYHNCK